MKKRVIVLGVALVAIESFAQLEMGTPFSDHLVLQCGMKVPVWGTAGSGSSVSVAFDGKSIAGAVNGAGRWRVELDALEASKESRTMVVTEVSAGVVTDRIEIRDVLVGEVWFASGQSNMECPIWGPNPRFRDSNGALVVAMTRLPNVRYCKNAHKWSIRPVPLKSVWHAMTPENLRKQSFSAVAYYYARELYLALDVPIGIVESSWCGTNIDAWTPHCGYEGCDPAIAETAAYEPKGEDAWDHGKDGQRPFTGPHQQPSVLWNGMVDAWVPMAVRGLIWYQGCYNGFEPHRYCAKMHALYNGWSRAFANPDLKLYLVMLAPYRNARIGMCAAQLRFVREQPNAAVAATADAGNFDDIHPNRKEVVARRLAVHALERDYGFDISEDDSPVLENAAFADGKAELTFSHVKNWYLYADDRSLTPPFELAGTNGVWRAAKIVNLKIGYDHKKKSDVPQPSIDGPKIVLSSDEVPEPVKARYMGKDRTMGTVYNEMSLPLGPFETR